MAPRRFLPEIRDTRNMMIAIMSLDLWILMNVRQSAKKIVRILSVVMQIVILISFVAGLLSIYALPHLKLRLSSRNDDLYNRQSIEFPKETLVGITDASENRHIPELEREINRLKNKALSLEMAFRKMNSQLRTLNSRDQFKDEFGDFASEAAGGKVLETPETESYYETKPFISLFGVALCKPNHLTPRKVIQPWSEAGECWAFKGDRGSVKIQLAYPAIIDRVTLEHVSATASLTGNIDSAPKRFRIIALFPRSEESKVIGSFVYHHYGPSSQSFQITEELSQGTPISIVTLDILSNWGNPNFTCVYRFKVHGRIAQ